MATEESKLKDKIKKLLKVLGVWYFLPVSRGMGVHGIPDFICCIPVTITPDMVGRKVGLFMGVETKSEGKFATERQALVIKQISAAGGIAFDLRPSELIRFKDFIVKVVEDHDGTTS